MKARLYVCGIDRGEIEVGDDSIVGLLARGLLSDAMTKVADMQEDVENLCSKPVLAPTAREEVTE